MTTRTREFLGAILVVVLILLLFASCNIIDEALRGFDLRDWL